MTQLIQRSYSDDAAQQLADSGFAPLLARIYAARGIRNATQLDTGLGNLLPFTQLKNAQAMAVLLAEQWFQQFCSFSR